MLGLTRITMTMLMQNIHKCPHAYTRERGEREREREIWEWSRHLCLSLIEEGYNHQSCPVPQATVCFTPGFPSIAQNPLPVMLVMYGVQSMLNCMFLLCRHIFVASKQARQSSLENWKCGLKCFYGPNSHHPASLHASTRDLLHHGVSFCFLCLSYFYSNTCVVSTIMLTCKCYTYPLLVCQWSFCARR